MTDKPVIIWYDNFWDYPLNGLVQYKGERLYFSLKDSNDPVPKHTLPKDIQKKIFELECKFAERMTELFGDEDTEYIGTVDDYEIERFDNFIVRTKVSYNMYRLPQDRMDSYLKYYYEWYIGRFGPFNKTEEYTKIEHEVLAQQNTVSRKITKEDLQSFEHVGTFKFEDV